MLEVHGLIKTVPLQAGSAICSPFPPGPLGVNGAALAACVENVDFLFDCCRVDGVKEGDSTFRVFLPDLGGKEG
jgi:hypothetical protein